MPFFHAKTSLHIMCFPPDQVTVGFKEWSTTVREGSGSIQISVGLEREVAVPVSLYIAASNGSALEGQGIVCSKGMSKAPTQYHCVWHIFTAPLIFACI